MLRMLTLYQQRMCSEKVIGLSSVKHDSHFRFRPTDLVVDYKVGKVLF